MDKLQRLQCDHTSENVIASFRCPVLQHAAISLDDYSQKRNDVDMWSFLARHIGQLQSLKISSGITEAGDIESKRVVVPFALMDIEWMVII